jgi:exonuclease III
MRFITLNIRGGLEGKIRYINDSLPHNTDAIALQETHTTPSQENQIEWKLNRWHCIWSHGNSDSRGVAILLNKISFPSPPQPQQIHSDKVGRLIWCTATCANASPINIASIYALHTNKECAEYLKNLDIPFQAPIPTLIGGDWNATWKKGERTTDKENWSPSSATRELKSFTYRHGLANTTKKGKIDLSFRARNSGMQAALDRWLISDGASKWSAATEIIPFPWSDHDAVVLFLVENGTKKEEMWKLNVSILRSQKTIAALKEGWEYRKTLPQRDTDTIGWWEDTKLHIRSILRTISTEAAVKQNARQKELRDSITTATSREQVDKQMAELKTIEETRIQGALIRSRIRWHPEIAPPHTYSGS